MFCKAKTFSGCKISTLKNGFSLKRRAIFLFYIAKLNLLKYSVSVHDFAEKTAFFCF
ncbi:hypothetical protein SAMN05444671_4111 [Flavobacterium sp. CF108]|nr:hypothetical protein SAMN04487978_3364 [Flavobacterium sp. fv08]SHH88915.1 hypothetical protein SAMN05444671_4111 [Flavobacterium sp. CF108]